MSNPKLFFKMLVGTIRTVAKDGEEEVTRMVHVALGDPLPDGVPADELERLQRIGAVGGKAGVSVITTDEQAAPDAPAAPASAGKAGGLDGLAALADADLAKALAESKAGVKKIVAAVGADAHLAARVLAAEKANTKGDPRASLVAALSKVIKGGASQ